MKENFVEVEAGAEVEIVTVIMSTTMIASTNSNKTAIFLGQISTKNHSLLNILIHIALTTLDNSPSRIRISIPIPNLNPNHYLNLEIYTQFPDLFPDLFLDLFLAIRITHMIPRNFVPSG